MKLFHSWKRWQLIALVCVVLTAVLTLVFVLQGGGGDTQPTGGTEGLQLATETLGDVTEPPETAAPTEGPTAAPTEATEAPTEASTEATKTTEAPTAVTQPATEAPTEPPATEPAAPSCTVSISCTTVLDNWDKLSESKRSIVPSNGIILGTGLGNADWNYSAPHGAGRILKREDVKNNFTVSSYKKEMKGIYSSCINKETLDEAPFAYRSLDIIKDAIQDTVRIDKILSPIYNFKAG